MKEIKDFIKNNFLELNFFEKVIFLINVIKRIIFIKNNVKKEKKIVFVLGVCGVGKTTYVKNQIKDCFSLDVDEFKKDLFFLHKEDTHYRTKKYAFVMYNFLFKYLINKKYNLVIQYGFLNNKSKNNYNSLREIVKENEYKIEYIVFENFNEEQIKRNILKRKREIKNKFDVWVDLKEEQIMNSIKNVKEELEELKKQELKIKLIK